MNYLEFKNIFGEFPVISSSQFSGVTKNVDTLKWNLASWQRRGLVIKLKKGLYVLNKKDRKIHPSRVFLANSLCFPSYVSTEYALGYYDLIPERVEDVTSVTTKKTVRYSNPFGTFIFQHIKADSFFGFAQVEDENGFPVLIAEPEKALLDFIYLNLKDFKEGSPGVFGDSYRFQNLDILRKRSLSEFATRYENRNLMDVVANLLEFIRKV